MKKILIAVFVLISAVTQGQIYTSEAGRSFTFIKTDSSLAIPVRDTGGAFIAGREVKRPGLLRVRPQDSLLYMYSGKKWNKVAVDSTGLIALLNGKVDSVKALTDTLFYYINGVAYGSVFTVSSLYPTSVSFNTATGLLTINRNGTTPITYNLDGRYSLIGHTHLGLTPIGGSTGQILKKSSNTDYDYSWQNEGAGYVPVARTLTINGTTYDLSADRSWTVTGASDTNFVRNQTFEQPASNFNISDNGVIGARLRLGDGDTSGVPSPVKLLSVYNSAATSGAILNGLFKTNQSVANSGSVQGVEGYTKISNATGTVALGLGTIGNIEVSGVGAVTQVRPLQGGGIFTSAGTISKWQNIFSAGVTLTGGGTINDYYGAFLQTPVLTSGTINNRWAYYSEDSLATSYLAGKLKVGGITSGSGTKQVRVDPATGLFTYADTTTVSITNGGNILVTGTYPSFTLKADTTHSATHLVTYRALDSAVGGIPIHKFGLQDHIGTENRYFFNPNDDIWLVSGDSNQTYKNASLSLSKTGNASLSATDTSYNYSVQEALGSLIISVSNRNTGVGQNIIITDTATIISGSTANVFLQGLANVSTGYNLSYSPATGKVTYDAAPSLSGYVPTSRTITTNAPLTGGGDLSANRTFGVDTTSGSPHLATQYFVNSRPVGTPSLTSTQIAFGNGSNLMTSSSTLSFTSGYLLAPRVQANSTTGIAVAGISTGSGDNGVYGQSDISPAIMAVGTNGNLKPAVVARINYNGGNTTRVTLNNVVGSINSSSVSAGYGTINRFSYQAAAIADTERVLGEFINYLTDATAYAEKASFKWRLNNSGTMADKMSLASTGAFRLHDYGIGTFTGTPATYPAFDASGNIIESVTPYSSGTPTLQQVTDAGDITSWQLVSTNGSQSSSLDPGGTVTYTVALQPVNDFTVREHGFDWKLLSTSNTANRNYRLPDSSGTIALLSNITGGSGEVNTASNIAGLGIGLFKTKSGVDLQFKRIKAGTGITVTDNTDSVTIATTAILPSDTAAMLANIYTKLNQHTDTLAAHNLRIIKNSDSLAAHNIRIGGNTDAIALKQNIITNLSDTSKYVEKADSSLYTTTTQTNIQAPYRKDTAVMKISSFNALRYFPKYNLLIGGNNGHIIFFHNPSVDLLDADTINVAGFNVIDFDENPTRGVILAASSSDPGSVIEINPVTRAWTEVVHANVSGNVWTNFQAVTHNDVHFLVAGYNDQGASIIKKYLLTDNSIVDTVLLANNKDIFPMRHAYTSNYLFGVTDIPDPTTCSIIRLNTTTNVYDSVNLRSTEGAQGQQLALTPTEVWTCNNSDSLVIANQSTLALRRLYVGGPTKGIIYAGEYIFVQRLTTPRTILRINPNTNEIQNWTYSAGEVGGFVLASDGQKIYSAPETSTVVSIGINAFTKSNIPAALPQDQILQGNRDGIAEPVTVTGDVTISKAVTAIGPGKVTDAMLANAKENTVGFTTLGRNIATLTNPSALGYIRANDDNTVTHRSYANVKVDLSLNNVENTALSTWAGSSSITTLGTVATGVWNGTAIANANLANSTISGVALGGTLGTLTFGSHLTSGGSSYNGSAGVTITTDAVSTPTASTLVLRDANANIYSDNSIEGFQSIATAAATTTLTVNSVYETLFTGSTTQTLVLPDATTLTVGHGFHIHNGSSGAVTVQTNGAATLLILAGVTDVRLRCTDISTSAGIWESDYLAVGVTSAKKLSVSNTLTLTATDGSSVAFGAGGTVAYTNVATLSSLASIGTITSGGLGTGSVIGGATMTLGSDANYDFYYRNSSGVLTRLAAGTDGQVLTTHNTTSAPTWTTVSGTGTVTSVAWTTSQGVSASIANSTTTPNITVTLGALTGVTSFNGLVVTANTGAITTGTWSATAIAETKGGTNQTSYTLGDLLYSSASNTLSKLAGNTTSNKRFLAQTGTGSVSAAPVWDAILEANATGIDPASLTNASGETHTITVTGAALGDYAIASFSIDLQGMILTAWVSATNTVSYRFVNSSGGTLNLGSGTVKVRVYPQ